MYSTYYGVYDDHSSSYHLGCQECQSFEIFIGVVVLQFSDIRLSSCSKLVGSVHEQNVISWHFIWLVETCTESIFG